MRPRRSQRSARVPTPLWRCCTWHSLGLTQSAFEGLLTCLWAYIGSVQQWILGTQVCVATMQVEFDIQPIRVSTCRYTLIGPSTSWLRVKNLLLHRATTTPWRSHHGWQTRWMAAPFSASHSSRTMVSPGTFLRTRARTPPQPRPARTALASSSSRRYRACSPASRIAQPACSNLKLYMVELSSRGLIVTLYALTPGGSMAMQRVPPVPPVRIEYRLGDGHDGAVQGHDAPSLPSPDYTRAVGLHHAGLDASWPQWTNRDAQPAALAIVLCACHRVKALSGIGWAGTTKVLLACRSEIALVRALKTTQQEGALCRTSGQAAGSRC